MKEPRHDLRWALLVFIFLTPRPTFAASDAQQPAQELAWPPAATGGEPEDATAPSTAKPATAPSEDYRATKSIPRRLLSPLLGCWQLDGQERWKITRLDANGAQVVTSLMKGPKKGPNHVPFPDQAKRAAIPSTLMYDAKQDNFGFSTAMRGRTSIVVFKHSGSILEASLFSKKSSKLPYVYTGYSATLDRCKMPSRPHSPRAHPGTVPPRLK